MDIVCIDPSLSCTAVVVNDVKAAFVNKDVATTKTDKLKKWFELAAPFINYHFHVNNEKLSYSSLEIAKLSLYNNITDSIISFIRDNITCTPKVFIEGYSYSSSAGPLVDLVTFGTLLRFKIFNNISKDVNIITPSELKLLAAKLTYSPIKEKNKTVWRNKQGVSGGQFKKPDMFKCLVENHTLNCEWVRFLRGHAQEILSKNAIPKPIEDINDAKLMFEIVKKINTYKSGVDK